MRKGDEDKMDKLKQETPGLCQTKNFCGMASLGVESVSLSAKDLRRYSHLNSSSVEHRDELAFSMEFLCIVVASHVLPSNKEIRGTSDTRSALKRGNYVAVVVHFTDDVFRIRDTQLVKQRFQGGAIWASLLRKNHHFFSGDGIRNKFISKVNSGGVCGNVALVKATFFLSGLLPPPASFTFVLVRKNRSGAGFTTNGCETLCMKGVVWDFSGTDSGPNITRGHVCERVVLDQSGIGNSFEGRINLDDWNIGSSSRALILTLTSDPCFEGGKLPSQWSDFSGTATFLMTIFIK